MVNQLNLEVISYRPGMKARIKRFDGFFYDVVTKKFLSATSTSLNPFINLVAGTALDNGLARASVDIDAAQFLNGDYTIYYHDGRGVFAADKVGIFNGVVSGEYIPNVTDNAVRLLAASVGTDTVRNTLLGAQQSVPKIETIYEYVISQTKK